MSGPLTKGRSLTIVGALALAAVSAVPVLTGYGPPALVARSISGAVFITAGGLTSYRGAPARVGTLLVLAGCALCLVNLSLWPGPVMTTVRVLIGGYALFGAVLIHLLLAYPTGHVSGRLERSALAYNYAVLVAYGLSLYIVGNGAGRRSCAPVTCDGIGPVWIRSDTAVRAFGVLTLVAYLGGVALVGSALTRRWRRATTVARHALRPVVISTTAACGLALTLAALRALQLDGAGTVRVVIAVVGGISTAGVAVGLLLGVLRSRLMLYGMGELVTGMSTCNPAVQVQTVLSRLLDDPTAQLLYVPPDGSGYRDVDGRAVADHATGRTWLAVGDPPAGAIVYDAACDPDPQVLDAVTSGLRLLLDNLRMQERLAEQLIEVRASRARIVAAGDAERRRIERDLHDGAQQHLVGSALTVRLARQSVRDAPERAEELLDHAEEQLREALQEIRNLARGLHPPILADEGVGAAVDSLTQRLPLDVAVTDRLTTRHPTPVETTAYFVACEALVNVHKHAHADACSVNLSQSRGSLLVEVIDHGLGGAHCLKGTGLRGLSDRLAAVGGLLTVGETAGGGTTIRAEIPSQGA